MATTNLLVWNPTAVNQENDAAYLADSQRAGGATDPSIFDATLANKLFYQMSTYLTGLFSAFAAKGFTTSDSNLPTLIAQCANFLTTADVLPAVQVVPYAATLTLNAGAANGFYISNMTGALNIAAINGLGSGQLIAMYYQQDSAGGRAVMFPGNVTGAAQPDSLPNAVSLQLFGYDQTTSTLRAMGPLISNNETVFTGGLFAPGLATFGSFTLTAPGSSGQVLTNIGGIFVPENPVRAQGTVNEVTSSRFVNTTYHNTSGGVLMISGACSTPTGGTVGNISVSIGPTTGLGFTAWGNEVTASEAGGSAGFFAPVPNSWYYSVNVVGSALAFSLPQAWLEVVVS